MYTHPDSEKAIATLVAKSITAIKHDPFTDTDIKHLLIEIIYKGLNKKSAFILHIYRPPSQRKTTLDSLLQEIARLVKGRPLVIGDFSAKDPSWGYPKHDAKGRN